MQKKFWKQFQVSLEDEISNSVDGLDKLSWNVDWK